MSIAPKILIAGTPNRYDYYAPYLEAVRGGGGDPVLDLPFAAARASDVAMREFLRPYSGILVPGGVDIDPARYGAERHPKLGTVDGGLDEAQLAVARVALKDGLRVLGICRGLQLLAVAVGAKLYQDLPAELPSSKVRHDIKEPKDQLAHFVDVTKESRLTDLSGAVRFEVNSRHHQAAKEDPGGEKLGPFRIAARAPDGVIEALEDPARPFCLAVQWHPENLVGFHTPSQGLFCGFITACE